MGFGYHFLHNTILCSYARSAIYLALMTFNVKGKKVMLPAFTCQTTLPSAIRYAGGIPVYVDIDKSTLNMDITDLLRKIDNDVSVVIVHCYYGGIPSNIKDIEDIARKNRILLLVDAAHSFGESLDVVGDAVVYSFSKTLCNPGGGCIVFKNDNLYVRASDFQKRHESIFHEICMYPIVMSYYNALVLDRRVLKEYPLIKISVWKKIVAKILRSAGLYKMQDYYKNISEIDYGIYDTRMTKKQHDFITKNLRKKEMIYNNRINIAYQLGEIFDNVVISKTFPLYAIFVSDVQKARKILESIGIKVRFTWPIFQRYTQNQLTENVCWVRDHLILLDTDTIDHKIIKYLKMHRGEIIDDM